jgi:hypothetical protein
MSAGKISLWLNRSGFENNSGNLHLAFLDAAGALWEYLQTPDNNWNSKQSISSPDKITFQSAKLVQGIASTVMLIALDTSGGSTGLLWYATSDDNGDWSNFTQLANQDETKFSCFDAVFIPYLGVVVGAVSEDEGLTYTQTTTDGVTWSQPGWNNQPVSPLLYSFFGAAPNEPPIAYYPPWPPQFNNVVMGDNGDVRQGDNAPLIAGLAKVPSGGAQASNVPLALYNDSSNDNWQWSVVPTVQKATTGGEWTANYPPYPVSFSDLYFAGGQGSYGPFLLLLGTDGNIYFIIATNGGVDDWTYYNASLPNPSGLFFTKAKMATGYVQNPDYFGNLQVVAINREDQVPYLIWHDDSVPDPTQGWWNYFGQLPAPNPVRKVLDFDVSMGASLATNQPALQVAYLAKDSSVFINYQTPDGNWSVYGGLD